MPYASVAQTTMKIRSDPRASNPVFGRVQQFHYNLLRHIVSPLVHVVSPGLVTRISSPEREGVWLTDLPSFIERRHNCVWQRVLLRNAFQILCKLGCARCAKDNTVPVREG